MTPNRLSEAFDIAQKINDKIEIRMSVTLQVNILVEAVLWMRLVGMDETITEHSDGGKNG